MKRKGLTDSEKLHILRRLADTPRPSQEVVAEEVRHRKEKIGKTLQEFQSMTWENAQTFCGDDQHILALRDDYADRKIAEGKDYEATLRSNEMQLRHELSLPTIYHYIKDGHSVMEF